jgi:hypothetical protein
VNKKEAKKTLLNWGRWQHCRQRPQENKRFLFFFSKKNFFFPHFFDFARLAAHPPRR